MTGHFLRKMKRRNKEWYVLYDAKINPLEKVNSKTFDSINRFFGLDWEAVPDYYDSKIKTRPANITISCVDTGAARKDIKHVLQNASDIYAAKNYWSRGIEPYQKPFYWMDFGNMMDRGQVLVGTISKIAQPAKSEFLTRETLPTIDKLHPDIFKDNKNDDQGPSCSLAEALNKQDLFINTNLANMGLGILWKMFREMRIKYNGLYMNLETMSVNPIKIN